MLQEIRPEFNFADSDDFIGHGYLDSFDIVQLVDAMDREFRISVDGLDIVPENFGSLDKMAKLIEKTKSAI